MASPAPAAPAPAPPPAAAALPPPPPAAELLVPLPVPCGFVAVCGNGGLQGACLCNLKHGKEQYLMRHVGHLYLGGASLQTPHFTTIGGAAGCWDLLCRLFPRPPRPRPRLTAPPLPPLPLITDDDGESSSCYPAAASSCNGAAGTAIVAVTVADCTLAVKMLKLNEKKTLKLILWLI